MKNAGNNFLKVNSYGVMPLLGAPKTIYLLTLWIYVKL